MLVESGRASQAGPIYRDLIKEANVALPQDHWLTHVFRAKYGEQLVAVEQFEEAEAYRLPSYEFLSKKLGTSHNQAVKTRARLAELYTAWGKPERATEFE